VCGGGYLPFALELFGLKDLLRVRGPELALGFNFFIVEQAEAAYRHALTINPTDVKVWNNLAGLLYENLRRPAEGVRCLERALKINPDHKQSWSNLATMVGRMGRHHQALAYADRAIALDPKLVEAYLHKATAARALGKLDVVREICRVLASLEPEHFRRAR
jgi:tetratricopeptide (TPR) repeat protein